MTNARELFARLLPAATMTSAFAALAHAAMVAVPARSVGFELVYIAVLSFLVAFVIALLGGAVLLAVTGWLRLGLLSSLLFFLIVIQVVAICMQFYLFDFEGSWADISWQYGLISVPAAMIAWYQSVFYVHKRV